jgi:hypothetical protein
MSWPETAALIIRARREGVALTARADGKLGWKTDRPLSDELLDLLKKYKYDILALIRLSSSRAAVGPARVMLRRVRRMGFEATLTAGALLISDTTGRQRDLSRRLLIGEVFDTIVAGLADDQDLLDLDTATAEPDLSDLDLRPNLFEPDLSNPGPLGLVDDPGCSIQ